MRTRLTYRPRGSSVILARMGLGVVAWLAAGYTLTTLAVTTSDEPARAVTQAWVVAILASAGFVALLEHYARLRPHAWTVLTVSALAVTAGRFAFEQPAAVGLTTAVGSWAVGAAASWVLIDASTDLIARRRLDLGHGPALTFGSTGVDFQPRYGRTSGLHLAWPDVRTVSLQLGPTGRPALCVTPRTDLASGVLASAGAGGTVPHQLRSSIFDTPVAVYLHRVRGPRLRTLDRMLRGWTDGRLRVEAAAQRNSASPQPPVRGSS